MRPLVLTLLGLLIPLGSLAHKLEAPQMVEAASDGSFRYECVFTVGPGTAFLAATEWVGVVNVLGGAIVDCFCDPTYCRLEEGETIGFSVVGSLQDPNQQGSVRNRVGLCEGDPEVSALTIVLPFGTSPVEAKTWTQIKALYR